MTDNVNHPSHYAEGRRFEPIDVIEDWGLDFHLGNAVKYISRAGRKGDAREDIEKAVWYLNRWLERDGGASKDVPTPIPDDLSPPAGSEPIPVPTPYIEQPLDVNTQTVPTPFRDVHITGAGGIEPYREPDQASVLMGLRDIS